MISIGLARAVLAAFFVATLCGCLPAGSSQPDEEKEPHFQRGRERVNAMDYGGAIESFEKALEVNPHSGAAHFELGWLYAEKQPEPAAAIYHYERYLKLRPRAENADTIRQHIFRLKQDLAKAVLPLPSTPGVQRQLEQLMEENKRLTEEVGKWQAYYTSRGAALRTNASVARPESVVQTASGPAATTQQPVQPNRQPDARAAARTYRVQAGDTPSSVARKYNVKLDALMSANPGLDPRRMQVGQVLNLPAP
jgi:LysM repeat protein